jgi:hypothetical protein
MEMYHKIKQKRLKGQPTKEEIEAHMLRYEEQKQAHLEQEKEFAEARKKDWKRKGGQLRRIGAGASPQKSNRLDFIEEQKQRAKEEEEQRRLRLEKGKEYGDAVRGGAEVASPRSPDKHHSSHPHIHEGSPRKGEPAFLTPVADRKGGAEEGPSVIVPEVVALVPSGSPRNKKGPSSLSSVGSHKESGGRGGGSRFSPGSQQSTPQGQDSGHKKTGGEGASADPGRRSMGQGLKRSIMSQSSVADGDLDSPYEGKVGSEWVSEVMDVDGEEGNLAVIYETGFLMFMMEKGIIKSSDMYDDIILSEGMVVATPPAKARLGVADLFAPRSAPPREEDS